jgi:type II secretory pathway predicted ATPase ExeA
LTIQRIYRSGGSRPCRSSDSTFGDNLNYTMSHSDKDSNNNINDRVRLLGVCGGIGSGKSVACRLLVSDLDCLAHIGKGQ